MLKDETDTKSTPLDPLGGALPFGFPGEVKGVEG